MKTNGRQYLLVAPLLLLLTGCATLAGRSTQRVWLISDPPGAVVRVDGDSVGVSPANVTVSRRKAHDVSFVRDSFRADAVLTRHPSPGLLAYLLLGVPGMVMAGVDILSGSGLVVPDKTVVLSPASPVVAVAAAPSVDVGPPPKKVLPVIDLPLRPKDRLRLSKPDVAEPPTFVIVDSVAEDRIVGRTLDAPDALVPDTTVIAIGASDVRRVAVYAPPDRAAGGWAMTRQSVRAMAPFLAVPQGAAVALLAYPAGYATGATLAEPRWAPREARRVGSPLLVNDTVEVRFVEDHRPSLRGRVLDLDRDDLLLTSAGTQIRLTRKDLLGVRRANGYHYRSAAIVVTLVSALVGSTTCRVSDLCRRAGMSQRGAAATAAVAGLLMSPAFAARRWSEVERW